MEPLSCEMPLNKNIFSHFSLIYSALKLPKHTYFPSPCIPIQSYISITSYFSNTVSFLFPAFITLQGHSLFTLLHIYPPAVFHISLSLSLFVFSLSLSYNRQSRRRPSFTRFLLSIAMKTVSTVSFFPSTDAH